MEELSFAKSLIGFGMGVNTANDEKASPADRFMGGLGAFGDGTEMIGQGAVAAGEAFEAPALAEAGALLGPAGAVLGAAGMGYEVGTFLDDTFGISDAIVGNGDDITEENGLVPVRRGAASSPEEEQQMLGEGKARLAARHGGVMGQARAALFNHFAG